MGPMGASRGAVETAAAGAWPSWGRLTWTSMRSQNRTFRRRHARWAAERATVPAGE